MKNILDPVTMDSAPEGSRPVLEAVRATYGFVPALIGVLANAPAAVQTYTTVTNIWETTGTLTPIERQLVLLAASTVNGCGYCSAAHATIAKGLNTDADAIRSVRAGAPLIDPKLNALVGLTRELVATRGRASRAMIDDFLAAGYTPAQVLEVLVGVTLKTLSNYLDHVNPSEIDAPFAAEHQPALA